MAQNAEWKHEACHNDRRSVNSTQKCFQWQIVYSLVVITKKNIWTAKCQNETKSNQTKWFKTKGIKTKQKANEKKTKNESKQKAQNRKAKTEQTKVKQKAKKQSKVRQNILSNHCNYHKPEREIQVSPSSFSHLLLFACA